jgi:hypothetical protein
MQSFGGPLELWIWTLGAHTCKKKNERPNDWEKAIEPFVNL